MAAIDEVQAIMNEFAGATGLSDKDVPPRRYLWTDAFAVCNFLSLFRRTGDQGWRQLALALVEQVHATLGRHRDDDPRSGWISGLSEQEGRRHPTMGGLRIGKTLNERMPGDPYDDRLEWDRDGQYYHYLTKWMHALDQVSRFTGDRKFNRWAVELARAAHAGFVREAPTGDKRMYWKMSIDLSRPLVAAMGQHDPVDGLITYRQLQATAEKMSGDHAPALDGPIEEMAALCRQISLSTDDPLGLGGLLCDAYRSARLSAAGRPLQDASAADLLGAALPGLEAAAGSRRFSLPAEYRLAFRELGLSIGLHAVEKMDATVPDIRRTDRLIERLLRHAGLAEKIETFWQDPENRLSPTWTKHQNINSVMLATSLAPDGYLRITHAEI